MGLSASQARLLSITARISDNELHSQQVANSKMRLADKTQEASREYVQALDSQKLVMTTYDAKGNSTQVNLTPALLYQFGENKNQYGISNNVGQLLISREDALNFKESNNIFEFMEKYGIDCTVNPEYLRSLDAIYGSQYANYYDVAAGKTLDGFNSTNFDVENGEVQFNKWVDSWNANMTEDRYASWKENISWMADVIGDGSYNSIYISSLSTISFIPANCEVYPGEAPERSDYKLIENFVEKMKRHDCYKYTFKDLWSPGGGTNCYMHVVADMLGPGTHTTSSGDSYEIITPTNLSWSWNTANHQDDIEGLSDVQEIIKTNKSYTNPEMTIYQKIVDFLWYAHDLYSTDNNTFYGGFNWDNDNGQAFYSNEQIQKYQECIAKFNEILETDLANVIDEERFVADTETYNNKLKAYDDYVMKMQNWQGSAKEVYKNYQSMLQVLPEPIILDEQNPKTKWYENLWHRLNGASNYKDSSVAGDGTQGKYYKVLENNLLNSQSWLQFALEQGIVTLEQVQFVNPAETGTGLANAKWQSKEYSTCVDISFVDDTTAIARAEAIYTKKLKEIESEDKKYDNEIKKLDTEHNALQTEYESVKSVVDKNVERSFKAFS